jgi:hypothetical protein
MARSRRLRLLLLLHAGVCWSLRSWRPGLAVGAKCRSRQPLVAAHLGCQTAAGRELAQQLDACDGKSEQRWAAAVTELGARWSRDPSQDPASIDLSSRLAELRRLTNDREILNDLLRWRVSSTLARGSATLVRSLDEVAPGTLVPPTAVTLDVARRFLPDEAARQLGIFLLLSAPSSDPSLNGRFDRLQGARLYMGHAQFGYFLAQVFCGYTGSAAEEVVGPEQAREIEAAIEAATRRMRSESAWAVASGRAGDLFALREGAGEGAGEGAAGAGEGGRGEGGGASTVAAAATASPQTYDELREFSTSVQVVGEGSVAEFFALDDEQSATEAEGGGSADGTSGDTPAAAESADAPAPGKSRGEIRREMSSMPSAKFVRFNAAGLQLLCAEASVLGYALWVADSAARTALTGAGVDEGGGAGIARLMPPQAIPSR